MTKQFKIISCRLIRRPTQTRKSSAPVSFVVRPNKHPEICMRTTLVALMLIVLTGCHP